MTTFQSRKNYTFLLFSNFSSEFDSQVEAKIGDARSYNHYITGNRKLNRASKSNHVGDKSWYYVESIISPPTLENFNLLEVTDISVFLSRSER